MKTIDEKEQLIVDFEVGMLQNPIWDKMTRILIDIQIGKASKEEFKKARELLKSVEEKMDQ